MKFEQPKQFRDFLTIHDKAELYETAPNICALLTKLSDSELSDEEFDSLITEHNANNPQPESEMIWYAFDIKHGRALELGKDKNDETKIKLGAWKPKL